MKTTVLAAGLTLAASMSASAGPVNGPDSNDLASNASARHLVERFVNAFARQDAVALDRTVTKDFTALLYRSHPIAQTTATSNVLAGSWQQQAHLVPSADERHEIVAIYPTPEAHTLFVTYHVAGQIGKGERIALVQLRGHRVARLSDFPGSSGSAESENSELAVMVN